MKAQYSGYSENLFLLCLTLQKIFVSQIFFVKSSRMFPVYLEYTVKKLLKIQRQKIVNLTNWSLVLHEQLQWDDCMKLFKQNLYKYRINKLCEVNFKIIHRILATPAVISKI